MGFYKNHISPFEEDLITMIKVCGITNFTFFQNQKSKKVVFFLI
jgi:L-rhamnose mutarotase